MTQAISVGKYPVSVSFKGERDYIQGPDLVEAALEFFAGTKIKRARFSSHSFIHHSNCFVEIFDESSSDAAPFRGKIETKDGSYWLTIDAETGSKIEETRVPYDEDQVIGTCQISGDSISRKGPSPFTLTETIVSMKKALLKTRYPDSGGKWIFTSVDYKQRPDSWDDLTIRIDHNFQNKLVKSSILLDGSSIGLLYFSLVTT